MSTEAWMRNPHNYIREMVEVSCCNVAWDRGILVKRSIDPDKHAALYFGRTFPWRALIIGPQGTAEIGPDFSMNKPKAVYPTWQYGEPIELLMDIIANAPGDNAEACNDMSVDIDERPVWGQEHRIIITDIPSGNSGPGRQILRHLKELQEEYPTVIIHVHGLYSYRLAFGLGFGAADVEPRSAAAQGRVNTPNGLEEKWEHMQLHPQWASILGFKPVDLATPRNRCMYNIKSAVWAGENYESEIKFRVKGGGKKAIDSESSDSTYKPVTTLSAFTGTAKIQKGDKFACDSCSLKNDCKYFRAGAVCSMPGAEPTELARYFKTRDADTIIDGLGTLLAANSKRLQRGMSDEDAFGDLNPEVTKVMSQVFDQGVKLAKLIDPNLRGGPKIQVNVGAAANGTAGATVQQNVNPRQSVAAAIRELELRGIKREDITSELITGVLVGPASDVVTGEVKKD